jgi:hypothetical protein
MKNGFLTLTFLTQNNKFKAEVMRLLSHYHSITITITTTTTAFVSVLYRL